MDCAQYCLGKRKKIIKHSFITCTVLHCLGQSEFFLLLTPGEQSFLNSSIRYFSEIHHTYSISGVLDP